MPVRYYTIGFLFSRDQERVALILKNRPAHLAGRWNGIGGKVDPTDVDAAMTQRREFREETGLDIPNWEEVFSFIYRGENHIRVFRAFGYVDHVRTTTDEQIGVFEVAQLPNNRMSNLDFIIPMCLHEELCSGALVIDQTREAHAAA